MGKDSAIEWTDHTFNPWWGCVKVSEGCKNCYAEVQSKRFGAWWGLEESRRFFGTKHWNEPMKWNRKAAKLGVQHKVFCGSMCDVFEDRHKLKNVRYELWELIEQTPHLDWLLLTKRPKNIMPFIPAAWKAGNMPENSWFGVSAENQKQADIRIPELLKIPAKVRFLSCEPLLEEVELYEWFNCPNCRGIGCDKCNAMGVSNANIQWVIVGGESGSKARPMNPDWARDIHHRCLEARVPFFMKQMDKIIPIPEDLFIREFPK